MSTAYWETLCMQQSPVSRTDFFLIEEILYIAAPCYLPLSLAFQNSLFFLSMPPLILSAPNDREESSVAEAHCIITK